jgi:DNA-binding transcriptional ArsR family regulator
VIDCCARIQEIRARGNLLCAGVFSRALFDGGSYVEGSNQENELLFEEVLGSRSRVKILRTLAAHGEMNVTAIVTETRLNHRVVLHHLQYLSQISFVQEKVFGRIRIFRFRDENLKAKMLKNLINFWEGSPIY